MRASAPRPRLSVAPRRRGARAAALSSVRSTRAWGVALAATAVWIAVVAPAYARVAAEWAPYELPKGNVVQNPGAESFSGGGSEEWSPWVQAASGAWSGSRYVRPEEMCQSPGETDCYISGVFDPSSGELGGFFFVSPGLPGGMTATQDIRLSLKAARAIYDRHTGDVEAQLDAWVGGWESESGYGSVIAEFLGKNGERLGRSVITTPVDATVRGGATTLVHRTASGLVPRGSRTIRVTMKAVAAAYGGHGLFFDGVRLTLGYKELHRSQAGEVVEELLSWVRPSCDVDYWRMRDVGVTAKAVRGGFRVGAYVAWYDRVSGRSVNGFPIWLVKSKEEVAPLNKLARYIQQGCPTAKPPGITLN